MEIGNLDLLKKVSTSWMFLFIRIWEEWWGVAKMVEPKIKKPEKKKVFSKLRDLKTNKMHKFLSYLNTNQNWKKVVINKKHLKSGDCYNLV